MHVEVIFQATLLPIEIKINSGIDIAIAYAPELRNIAVPARRVVPDKVIAVPRQLLDACDLSFLVCPREPHAYNRKSGRILARSRQCKHRIITGQIERVAHSMGQKSDAGIALTLIRFKTDG